MYCIDLFAGAGGLSTGLSNAGFKCLYANEISPSYSKTLISSHSETFVETGDIKTVDARSVRKSLQIKKGDLDLVAGGPPCQGFSINAPIRSSGDHRNHLFRDYLRFVEEFNPKVVLIENVPGMVSFEKGDTVTAILQSLRALGYQVTVRIVYAAHYGIPQMRWRTVFIGNRIGIDPAFFFPIPTHKAFGRANFTSKYKGRSLILDENQINEFADRHFVTVDDAISDLPNIENGGGKDFLDYPRNPKGEFQIISRQKSDTIMNHRCARLGLVNLERLPHIPPGGSWRDIPFDLLPKGMKRARRSDHTKRYGRLHPDGIGSTILTKCDPHWGTYIHPTQERVLSVREAARIQSFPDRIIFEGSLTEQYEQVGNAVPPLLAKALGDRIFSILEGGVVDDSSPWRDTAA
jgi:DNA (cytosine-5)-methyltransferase 1